MAGEMLRDEVVDHRVLERLREVHDLERHPRGLGRCLGVGASGRPATAMIDPVCELHEAQMDAGHVVALAREHARGDRRVDPAGHRHEHGPRRHAFQATGQGSGATLRRSSCRPRVVHRRPVS
jgi:hypothetical protein